MVLTSFYLNSLNNDQIKEKTKTKTKTKTLLVMSIVVAIMTLYYTDIVQYIKSFNLAHKKIKCTLSVAVKKQ